MDLPVGTVKFKISNRCVFCELLTGVVLFKEDNNEKDQFFIIKDN